MNESDYSFIAPSLFPEKAWSEAEVLGAMVVLWSQNDYYGQISISSALELLISIVKTKQFALISENKRPIGYLCWAFMDEKTEKDYLENNGHIERFIGCNNGEQLWILTLFSAPNESYKIPKIAQRILFPTESAKWLYHKGKEKGFKVFHFYGSDFKK